LIFDDLAWQTSAPPTGASFCEDYKAVFNQTLCNQLAGSPWYMPCKWSNSSQKCNFKVESVFGNTSQSLIKIENKKNCEAAGGCFLKRWEMDIGIVEQAKAMLAKDKEKAAKFFKLTSTGMPEI